MSKNCEKWLNKNRVDTPFLIFDLNDIKRSYNNFKKFFPNAKSYYAVKANPNNKIIKKLNSLGSFFDAASIAEINICIECGVSPKKISFGNTIKKSIDIHKAFALGIRLYAFDSEEELIKISKNAPKSKAFCRIMVPNGGAEWPLSKKFGCSLSEARKLILKGIQLNVDVLGASFHVGSQQISTSAWRKAIKSCAKLYNQLEKNGIILDFINIGGGIPINYKNEVKDLFYYSSAINKFLIKYFKDKIPKQIIVEPGRYLVGESGIIETEVILVSQKNNMKWVYIDIGRYGGLAETEGEAIKYQIKAYGYNDNVEKEKFIIAGPSCDGNDIIYKKNYCLLPKDLKEGDRLRIFSTGAYTTVYKSEFNNLQIIQEKYLSLLS